MKERYYELSFISFHPFQKEWETSAKSDHAILRMFKEEKNTV